MRTLALLLVAGALVASGCMLDSKRVTVSQDLQPDSLSVGSSSAIVGCPVDLNQSAAYRSHKSETQGLADVALVGEIRNTLPTFARPEWWITADATTFTSALDVRNNAVRLWSGGQITPLSTLQIDWNKSAGHIEAAGLEVLRREVQGDGIFTLYAIGALTGTSFRFSVLDAALVLVLDVGS
jgi:hypothetical protein